MAESGKNSQAGRRIRASRMPVMFFAMALLLVAGIWSAFHMGVVVIGAVESLADREVVLDHLFGVLSTLKDAETGQRGYLLTNDRAFLDPYQSAQGRIDPELRALDDLAGKKLISADQVAALRRNVEFKLQDIASVISLVDAGDRTRALEQVRSGRGKAIMEDLRGQIANLSAAQKIELAAEQSRVKRLATWRSEVFLLVALLNLGFLAWIFRRVRREMRAREEAVLETERQKELLSVTLASIGDAVIVTDIDARITFMNGEAQKLTGWPLADAIGVELDRVFRIINEETRNPVESPVRKVLRLGGIVGLANHTLLVRRDGVEIPIDDSGAPVRKADGPIRGVVLIFRDFSQHKNAEKRLLRSKVELERANQAKDRFLAMLSHELRTPLMPVLTTLSVWETDPTLPADLRGQVQMLRRNIDLEARLIDDLLDLTRIIKGKLTLQPEPVDANALLKSVTGMYQSDLNAKRIDLVARFDARRNYVNADPARLQQVFWNILKNAVKFTPEGGRIEVSTLDRADESIEVTFTDSGIGMSAQTLEKLFLPFQQGVELAKRNFGGLGLGMAIAKALVDVQGGAITAASDGTGKGATFRVILPAISTPAPQSAPSAVDDAPRRDLQILLVEDHEDTAEAISRLLRGRGHRVHAAGSVADALELARANQFDVILSDIGLPDGTGMDLVRQIPQYTQAPAVALTGFGMEEDITRCMEAGFAAHLTKPVNFQRLELVLQQTANGR